MNTEFSEKQRQRRIELRARGKRYVLWHEGVLRLGIPLAIVYAVVTDVLFENYLTDGRWDAFGFKILTSLLVFGIGVGLIWGYVTWKGLQRLESDDKRQG